MVTVIGIVLIIVAGILLLVRRSQQGKLVEIQGTLAVTARELQKACEYVAERLGEPGSFKQIAEVSGIARSDKPLTSEMAKEPCLYSSVTVTREYEEDRRDTDSQTKQQVRKTRRGSETVFSNTRSVPFWVEDATGPTWVDPMGADVAAIQVVDRFESTVGGVITLGGYSFDVGALVGQMLSDGRTLGYHFRERILPVSSNVHVLGEAADSSGILSIQKPSGKGKFIISLDSEESVRSARLKIHRLLAGAIASGVAGVGLVIADLAK